MLASTPYSRSSGMTFCLSRSSFPNHQNCSLGLDRGSLLCILLGTVAVCWELHKATVYTQKVYLPAFLPDLFYLYFWQNTNLHLESVHWGLRGIWMYSYDVKDVKHQKLSAVLCWLQATERGLLFSPSSPIKGTWVDTSEDHCIREDFKTFLFSSYETGKTFTYEFSSASSCISGSL